MVKIRLAAIEDAVVMARIHVDTWRAAYRGLVPDCVLDGMSYTKREESWIEAIAGQSQDIFVVEDDELPVGILTIGASRDEDVETGITGEIWGIYLIQERWRSGIGTWVMGEAERMLSARGFTLLTLWVFEENSSARRFYEAMGYRPDGGRKTLEKGKVLGVVRYRKVINPEDAG